MYPYLGAFGYFAGFGAITATALTATGTVTANNFQASADGDGTTRAFGWTSDPDTGLHRGTANRLMLGGGGNTAVQLDATAISTNYTILSNDAIRVSGGAFSLERTLTPASLNAGPHADLSAWSLSIYNAVRQDLSANSVVSGASAPSVADFAIIYNISASFTLTINHEDAASTAANRFICPNAANLVIRALGSMIVRYDTTSSRWRVTAVE